MVSLWFFLDLNRSLINLIVTSFFPLVSPWITRYPLLPGYRDMMWVSVRIIFSDLYISILFHVLSGALEDTPFVYGIACCRMSGWWSSVLLFSLQMLVCAVAFEIIFLKIFLDFLFTRACCSSLSWTSLVGFLYYFYVITWLIYYCNMSARSQLISLSFVFWFYS